MNPGKSGEHRGNEPLISVVKTTEDLATAKAIRHQIFVREQGIAAELDNDGLDDGAIHALLWIDGKAVGTGRLVLSSKDTGILARIAVLAKHRGRQLGGLIVSALEEQAIRLCLTRLELCPHVHLEAFYQNLVLFQGDKVRFSVPVVFRSKARCAGNGPQSLSSAAQRRDTTGAP